MLRGEELSAAYASADIFVMPSETETLGFVALEAMASGLPVVAVAAGGLVDIVTKPGVIGESAISDMLLLVGANFLSYRCHTGLWSQTSLWEALQPSEDRLFEQALKCVQHASCRLCNHLIQMGFAGLQGICTLPMTTRLLRS